MLSLFGWHATRKRLETAGVLFPACAGVCTCTQNLVFQNPIDKEAIIFQTDPDTKNGGRESTLFEDPFLEEDIEASAHLTFGIEQMHGFQKRVVKALLTGRDALVVQPTAAGKSLCYQLPAFMLRGTVLVVSPLISLMEQQSNALNRLGLKTAFLAGGIDPLTAMRTGRQFETGGLDLLFVAPERLHSAHFLNLAVKAPLRLLTVDEAHCMTTWGHDFRPDYARIGQFVSVLNRAKGTPKGRGKRRLPVLALTATADRRTCLDIVRQLALDDADQGLGRAGAGRSPSGLCRECALPDRPNLRLTVGYRRNGYKQVLEHLQNRFSGKRGIIYCPTRALVERLTTSVNQNRISALPYHAGLNRDVRSANQALYEAGKVDVMVATLAFGMGIDAPDLGFVLRLGLPQTLEAFLQEAGRAGRDGREAEVLTLFNERDAARVRTVPNPQDPKFMPQRAAEENTVRANALFDLLLGKVCISDLLQRHFSVLHAYEPRPCGTPVDSVPHKCGCPKCSSVRLQREEAVRLKSCVMQAVAGVDARLSPAGLTGFLTGKPSGKTAEMALEDDALFGKLAGTPRVSLMIAIRDLIADRRLVLDPETGLVHSGLVH